MVETLHESGRSDVGCAVAQRERRIVTGRWSARAIAVALLLLRNPAEAAIGCEAERDRTGLGVAVREGEIVVSAVDTDGAAVRSGVRSGDVVVQVNGAAPHTCAEWAQVLRSARREGLAVVLLVRRDSQVLPLALDNGIWVATRGATGVGRASTPPPVPDKPARRVAPPPATVPLPPEVPVSVGMVVRTLKELPPEEGMPGDLETYRQRLVQAERAVATLGARGAASPEALADLQAALRCYQGAAVAWEAMNAVQSVAGRRRQLPIAREATAPYLEDSPAAVVVSEFSFLNSTVVREPISQGPFEFGGLWRPAQARALLWGCGRDTIARVEL